MVKEATTQREQAEARMAALEKEKREWEETMKAKQTQMGEALKVVATRRREA